jgi:2-oxoglutarate dehydrogenase complex dehydrogenase (E1) component-like enzyme
MYDMWVEDPKIVHASWAAYFTNVEGGVEEPYQQPPSLGQDNTSGAIPNLE